MNGCSDEFPLARIQPQTSICPSSCWVALKSRKAGLFRSRRTERIPFSTTVISEPVRAYGMGDLYCVVAHPTNRTDKAATARVRGLVIALRVGARSRVWEPAKLKQEWILPTKPLRLWLKHSKPLEGSASRFWQRSIATHNGAGI